MSKKAAKPISKTTAKRGITAKKKEPAGRQGKPNLLEAWEKIESMFSVRELKKKRPNWRDARDEVMILRSITYKLMTLPRIIEASGEAELVASFANAIGRTASAINAFPPELLNQAKVMQMETIAPWPLALSGDPLTAKYWDEEKRGLQEAFSKADKAQLFIHPFRLPALSSAIGPVVKRWLREIVMAHRRGELPLKELPPFDAANLTKWQRLVMAEIECHSDFPEGAFFLRVKRNPAAKTKGQRADEIRKAVRECFRTIKRHLEGEEALRG